MHITVNASKPHPQRKMISFRKFKSVDHAAFAEDLQRVIATEHYDAAVLDTECLSKRYECTLRKLLEQHAPVKKSMLAVKARAPWYTAEIAEAKKLRRKYERRWRKTKLTIHRDLFKEQKRVVSHLIQQTREAFYNRKVEDCRGNQKALFRIVDNLLHEKNAITGDNLSLSAEAMSVFFQEKIQKIWGELQTADRKDKMPASYATPTGPPLRHFEQATEEEVGRIVKSMSNATCTLDPIPTSFVKQHLPILLPTITGIVNSSISTGVVPSNLKTAMVVPRIKKTDLDADDAKNYRPISNLPFISKVIERVVSARIASHMETHQLHQSAYKPGHSTETALLKVKNDILLSMESKCGALMVLLDLSAAFDTVCHDRLLQVLNERIGLQGTALLWFRSYLEQRTQSVSMGGSSAPAAALTQGVPQGSVLGPVLFSIYTLALGDTVRHGIDAHFYADDSQLYASFDIGSNPSDIIGRMETCIEDIRVWMNDNFLHLNPAKTEVICFASRRAALDPVRSVQD